MSLVRRLFGSERSLVRREELRWRFRPQVTHLEDRVTPTVFTWTGAGTNANWSTSANWSPLGRPSYFDDVVLPSSAARKTNTCDYLDQLHSVSVQGTNYVIGGTVGLLRLVGAGGVLS